MTFHVIITRLGGWVFAPESVSCTWRSHPNAHAVIVAAVMQARRDHVYELAVTVKMTDRERATLTPAPREAHGNQG